MHHMGTGHEQQIEAGKAIVKEMLASLAIERNEPKIKEFVFKITDRDFDRKQISLFDPDSQKVVTKVEEEDLADCPATPTIKSKLKRQLDAAVRAYFGARS